MVIRRSSLRHIRAAIDQSDPSPYAASGIRGLSEALVRRISEEKSEPRWMLQHRLHSLRMFQESRAPSFGPDLSEFDLDRILFYAHSGTQETDRWEEIPASIRRVYDALKIPRAERRMLAGVGAQYESDIIYHRLKERWQEKGVIFLNMDEAVRTHPDLLREYFMQCVLSSDHRYAALHGAVWSGGTFLYVPKGVRIEEPLQAYFRMNAPGMGQFEHTLIVADEGSEVHYIEGCSAPKYGTIGLHAGCVEIFVRKGAKVRYSSVENWSRSTFNLNTKRAIVGREGAIEWVGGNMGSRVTMLYPCSVLAGEGARADHLGLAFASRGQVQDTGAKVIHSAPHTTSSVVSKSVSTRGGKCVYRGLVNVLPSAVDCTASVRCDALLLDPKSSAETVPDMQIRNENSTVSHEARVGKLSSEDLFYLMSRGCSEEEALAMIVNGFFEPVVRKLPLEYAVEMNRLIELEMGRGTGV